MSDDGTSTGDTKKSIKTILSSRGTSLAAELREIQQHAYEVEKDHRWANDLWCLQYDRSTPGQFREVCNENLKDRFVAISYTWEASSPSREDATTGGYSIIDAKSGAERPAKVRDSILDRVVKYLDAVRIRTFWIDQECIDQDDKAVKALAVNSMDLVYRGATKSLGLLSTPIPNQTRLHLIERLIEGRLAWRNQSNICKFRTGIPFSTIVQVIGILRKLTADPWWHRAWIFQEEYISGMHMDLLIPLASGLQATGGEISISGELCVCAPVFREQATTFLLAVLGEGEKKYRRYHESCDGMLDIVGKYNILLQQNRAGPGSMSVRIYSDVIRRGITQPWDTLAITANACGYKIRLDRHALIEQNRSLSLSLLAQFLLNGEIVVFPSDPHSDEDRQLDLDLIPLLEQISLQDADVPVDSGQLTFLKNCRLPEIEFLPEGMLTRGHTWELKNDERSLIHTSDLEFEHSADDLYARPWEAMELVALADLLQWRGHPGLCNRLWEYTERRIRIHELEAGQFSPAGSYMELMAWRLVQAVQLGLVLRVGYLSGAGRGGIFIPDADDIEEPMYVLTTWQAASSLDSGLDNYVSLKVFPTCDGRFAVEKWINGLVFFPGKSAEPVMIEWPQHWIEERPIE